MLSTHVSPNIMTVAMKLKAVMKVSISFFGVIRNENKGLFITFANRDLGELSGLDDYKELDVNAEVEVFNRIHKMMKDKHLQEVIVMTRSMGPFGTVVVSFNANSYEIEHELLVDPQGAVSARSIYDYPLGDEELDSVHEVIKLYRSYQLHYQKQASFAVRPEDYISEQHSSVAAYKLGNLLELVNLSIPGQAINGHKQPDGSYILINQSTGESLLRIRIDMMGETAELEVTDGAVLVPIDVVSLHYLGQASQYLVEAVKVLKELDEWAI